MSARGTSTVRRTWLSASSSTCACTATIESDRLRLTGRPLGAGRALAEVGRELVDGASDLVADRPHGLDGQAVCVGDLPDEEPLGHHRAPGVPIQTNRTRLTGRLGRTCPIRVWTSAGRRLPHRL